MSASHTDLLLTTNPGLEDLVARELRGVADAAGVSVELPPPPDQPSGRVPVRLALERDAAVSLARGLHTIHHILRPVATLPLTPGADRDEALAELRALISALDVPELDGAASFRVSTKRTGEHPYTSEDAARAGGAGVRDRHPGLPVDLDDYAVNLRADVRDDTLTVAVQHTRVALSRRRVGPFRPRVALKAPVAWAMLTLAAEALGRDPAVLLDPFCGSGTLLREAGARWPSCRLLGSDAFPVPTGGARENLDALGLSDRSDVRLGDATALRSVWPELRGGGCDLIVANPPYGRRLGARTDLYALYHAFLVEAADLVPVGHRLVVIATARRRLNKAIRHAHAWHTEHVRVVETGGIWPLLVVLVRRPDAPAPAQPAETA